MPFGLCNAPGTFQRCMIAIFHDIIEETMEVFMDDFPVFGDSFSSCLSYLDKMLKRCEDMEKCHFMVKEGIVIGHKISKSRIEVDREKVVVIAKLSPPTSVKGIRSFLGHARFYRRFIQDFSKIARPMTHLLKKETSFIFSTECREAFETLKKKLTEASILVDPDWDLPIEIICDASDFAVGPILGQPIFHDIIEETMEVFMDDFPVFGDSFSSCLSHLDKMLKRCEDMEKCHFMVKEGIVIGHKISKSGIEVDREKVVVIAKLSPPTSVKGIRSF
nr:reverse transcriptase domain-containing protein [Tanacetum cinerariifolium]